MEADVAILGGGPAGSMLALRLAQLGHAVTLVERSAFPRPHVGESLGPAITNLLDVVGLRARIEAAGFFRPRTALIRWEKEETEVKDFGPVRGYQVDRGRFDQILLEAAADAGVRVLQPATARRPRRSPGRGWVIPLRRGGRELFLTARYCADACGRIPLLGGTRATLSPRTLALYAYWQDAGLLGCDTRVEAGATEWYWGAPLPDGTVNVAVFLDPRRCAGLSRAEVMALYHSLVSRSHLLRECLNGTVRGQVMARDTTSVVAEPLAGVDFIRVGDAAFTIDPLSSQGVQTALLTALQAAAVINTTLRRPDDTAHAVRFYGVRQRRRAEQSQGLAAQFYAARAERVAEKFWSERAVGASPAPSDARREPLLHGARLRLSADAKLVKHPVLCGDLVALEEALVHPRLEEPCAFVNGVRLGPLLKQLGGGQTAGEILDSWAGHLPPPSARRLLGWLWEIGAVSPATTDGSRPRS